MTRFPLWLRKIFKPGRIVLIQQAFGSQRCEGIRILDVGCGPHAMYTKAHFNVTEYHGVDKQMWPGFEELYTHLDKMFYMDLEQPDVSQIQDAHYNLIIMSHVIEHLGNGLEVIEMMTKKLAPNGVLYIESPSVRTINYPSAIGFMNFYDDPTHKRLYFDNEIIHTLQATGLRVLFTGFRRTLARTILLPPISLLLNLFYYLPVKRRITAWGLWELLGVARVWVGIRQS
jgi:2-polyprenyl-3-methyl-5-hydroxy-6-metoxy-1,4-benzoquinol methylase